MSVAFNPWPTVLALGTLAFLAVLLVVNVATYRRSRRQGTLVAVLVLAGGLAAAGGLYGLSMYQAYQASDTWRFEYTLDIQGNGSLSDSVIVPVPADERLLTGLALTSGHANWSLVDTPHGRGLYVRFSGSVILQAAQAQFPPPAPLPDTTPTMPAITNCTVQSSNCTGPPQVWLYHSGTAGVSVALFLARWYIHAYPVTGWATYDRWTAPVPAV